VVDGTDDGGTPKGIELYAQVAIADLSVYSVIRDTNGAGPFDTATTLPSISLAMGDFFYIAGNADSATNLADLGFTCGYTNAIANVNGDDILGTALTSDPYNTVIDSFGQEGQGDTDFYADSFAVRLNSSVTGQVPGQVDAANFTITSFSSAGIEGASGFGSYAPVAIPEPSTLALFGLALGMITLYRRKRS